ncbi:hypothetical protein L226DRAFT_164016 [Lentinus tigrinus ALCF2SS1-7]|uniref:Uncharacterized protein n=1 Tax=Lentinus tigrinus ALCF2SS1-6 TaxID=1328759 RepID=A0A5C2S2H4_9APHY|nr:hypothetical protein L227DRAFT_223135 [Lentinus tigrinus ALCF2SS1-6]RPD71869.1 hypothetical protein L226DRAFT_164016 [Lentinus tigrinus ALCF2SS1-7]
MPTDFNVLRASEPSELCSDGPRTSRRAEGCSAVHPVGADSRPVVPLRHHAHAHAHAHAQPLLPRVRAHPISVCSISATRQLEHEVAARSRRGSDFLGHHCGLGLARTFVSSPRHLLISPLTTWSRALNSLSHLQLQLERILAPCHGSSPRTQYAARALVNFAYRSFSSLTLTLTKYLLSLLSLSLQAPRSTAPHSPTRTPSTAPRKFHMHMPSDR